MGIIRPATPGFLATLAATILLAIVSFCVPYVKSVYFLKASIDQNGTKGSIIFGTLGYCIELASGTNCSSPSVGYELDINDLVGNDTKWDIPNVVVKWITYALVLHIVALAFAAGSAIFGLLAHVREMSMACCSIFVSGFAAVVAMFAFIFDIVLFFLAKARINAVGKAEMGNAIWLTLAAWLLLFFSGCFYTIGRCCVSKRSPRAKDWKDPEGGDFGHRTYSEQMRLDAVKAEADRKNRQKEQGLPEFHESQPLTARVEGDQVYTDEYADPVSPTHTRRPTNNFPAGGYVPAAPGSRAVDEYYNPTSPPATAAVYPPRRQGSNHTYASNFTAPTTTSPPPMPNSGAYLAAGGAAAAAGYNQYGHAAGGSSYHSTAAHEQQPAGYFDGQNNAYADPYSAAHPPATTPYSTNTAYYTPPATTPYPSSQPQPERSYTLGGDGYGQNSVPYYTGETSGAPMGAAAAYSPYQQHQTPSPGIGPSYHPEPSHLPYPSSPVHEPVPSRQQTEQQYEDSPPGYDAGPTAAPGAWGVKR